MKPKSGKIRNEWLQLDTLCCGMDWDEADLKKPQILVEDVWGDSHPGSVHLDSLAREASIGSFPGGRKAGPLPRNRHLRRVGHAPQRDEFYPPFPGGPL